LQKKNHDAGNAQSISHKEEMLLGISHKGEMKEKGLPDSKLFFHKKRNQPVRQKQNYETGNCEAREERAGT